MKITNPLTAESRAIRRRDSIQELLHRYLFAWGFYQGAGRPARLIASKRQWMRENGLQGWPS